METMNIDLRLFMETTLITGLHKSGGLGYEVSATEAKNIHQGDCHQGLTGKGIRQEGGRRGMDLPERRGSASNGGSADDRRVCTFRGGKRRS
jgi:hypothetical protein